MLHNMEKEDKEVEDLSNHKEGRSATQLDKENLGQVVNVEFLCC